MAPWLPPGQLHGISSTSPCVGGGGGSWVGGWLGVHGWVWVGAGGAHSKEWVYGTARHRCGPGAMWLHGGKIVYGHPEHTISRCMGPTDSPPPH